MQLIQPNSSCADAVECFTHMLEREFSLIQPRLSDKLFLMAYSPTIIKLVGAESDVYRHHFCAKLEDAYNLIQQAPHAVVVDAGCGIGTEALFFGMMGVRVHAVAIDDGLMEIVPARLQLFQELLGQPLDVHVHKQNITRFMDRLLEIEPESRLRVVWASEAISHFFPPEDFFRSCGKNLRQGDKLVICEENPHHPVHPFIHGTYPDSVEVDGVLVHARTYQDDVTAEEVLMADENALAPATVIDMARMFGFGLYSQRVFRYFPNFCYSHPRARAFCRSVERALAKILPYRLQVGLKYCLIFSR